MFEANNHLPNDGLAVESNFSLWRRRVRERRAERKERKDREGSDSNIYMFAPSRVDAAVRCSDEGGVEALVRGLRDIAVGSGLALPHGGSSAAHRDAPARRPAQVSLRKFLSFAQRLISKVASDHLSLMSEGERAEAFDCFFDGQASPQVHSHPRLPCHDRRLFHDWGEVVIHCVLTLAASMQVALPALHALVGAIGPNTDDFTMQQVREPPSLQNQTKSTPLALLRLDCRVHALACTDRPDCRWQAKSSCGISTPDPQPSKQCTESASADGISCMRMRLMALINARRSRGCSSSGCLHQNPSRMPSAPSGPAVNLLKMASKGWSRRLQIRCPRLFPCLSTNPLDSALRRRNLLGGQGTRNLHPILPSSDPACVLSAIFCSLQSRYPTPREQTFQLLVSLPDRLANRLQGKVPRALLPSTYFSSLARGALYAASQCPDEAAAPSGQPRFLRIRHLWSRLRTLPALLPVPTPRSRDPALAPQPPRTPRTLEKQALSPRAPKLCRRAAGKAVQGGARRHRFAHAPRSRAAPAGRARAPVLARRQAKQGLRPIRGGVCQGGPTGLLLGRRGQ